jgi:hypothetical protein
VKSILNGCFFIEKIQEKGDPMNKEEQINYARFLIDRVSKDFLQEGSQYIIQEGFEHIRDLLILYGKQTNLLDSVLVLIEHNMSEEAFILLRSMINNYMLIEYLQNDNESRSRYKDFCFQPLKSTLKFLYDLRKGMDKGWIEKESFPEIHDRIAEHQEILKENGYSEERRGKTYYDTRPITIASMAWEDKLLYNYYITHYRIASAFEHSDPSSLDIYKEEFMSEHNTNALFTFDLSKTDVVLEETVLKTSIGVYTMSYLTLLKFLTNNYEYLIESRKQRLIELGLIMNSTNL